MKLVLISAPYSSASVSMREDITRVAEATSILLWENGIGNVCPHLNSGHFSDHKDVEYKKENASIRVTESGFYASGYVEIAKRVDAILVLFPGRKAPGSIEEVKVAKQKGKPVFKDVKDVLKWGKE